MRAPMWLLIPLAALLGGCAVAVHEPPGAYYGPYYDPPPRFVPYHGYRYRNPDGMVLVYDSGLSLYLVLGHVGLYWWDGRYYREHGGYWEHGAHYRGPWRRGRVEALPLGLRKRHEADLRQRERDRGPGRYEERRVRPQDRERRPDGIRQDDRGRRPERDGKPYLGR